MLKCPSSQMHGERVRNNCEYVFLVFSSVLNTNHLCMGMCVGGGWSLCVLRAHSLLLHHRRGDPGPLPECWLSLSQTSAEGKMYLYFIARVGSQFFKSNNSQVPILQLKQVFLAVTVPHHSYSALKDPYALFSVIVLCKNVHLFGGYRVFKYKIPCFFHFSSLTLCLAQHKVRLEKLSYKYDIFPPIKCFSVVRFWLSECIFL